RPQRDGTSVADRRAPRPCRHRRHARQPHLPVRRPGGSHGRRSNHRRRTYEREERDPVKIYVVPLLAAISFVAAVGWTYSVRPRHEPTLPAAPPPESTADKTIAAVGLVEPESEHIELSCAVSGMVTSLYVKAGDRVSKGQRLFAVDDRDL